MIGRRALGDYPVVLVFFFSRFIGLAWLGSLAPDYKLIRPEYISARGKG